jgi:beta-lactamase class A
VCIQRIIAKLSILSLGVLFSLLVGCWTFEAGIEQTPTNGAATDGPVATEAATAAATTETAMEAATVIYQLLSDGSVRAVDVAAGQAFLLADPTTPGQALPWVAAPHGQSIAVITGRNWQYQDGTNWKPTLAVWTVGVDESRPRKLLDLLPADARPSRALAATIQQLTTEQSERFRWVSDRALSIASAHEGQVEQYLIDTGSGQVRSSNEAPAPNDSVRVPPIPTASSESAEQAEFTITVGGSASRYYFAQQDQSWQLFRDDSLRPMPIGPFVEERPTNPWLVLQSIATNVPATPTASAGNTDGRHLPTPVADAPLPDPAFEALQAELNNLVASWAGDNAVSVMDLQSQQTIAVNGARSQVAACTIKIPIMIAAAQDIEAGHYTAEDVAGLVEPMMGPSYIEPARELLDIIGGGDIGAGIRRVNQIMWDLGATGSIMTHPPGRYWEEYGYADSHGITDNLLTTDDLVLILGKLYRGEVLSPWATDYVLASMTIAPDWMDAALGSPLPPEAQLYHKVGQLYEPHNTWNDAGIVVFERNGQMYAYALAYLSSYGPSWQNAYDHATSVSESAWRYFSTIATLASLGELGPV